MAIYLPETTQTSTDSLTPRQIVADITVIGELRSLQDGSVSVKIEALTVEE